jgi:hypothetical protein
MPKLPSLHWHSYDEKPSAIDLWHEIQGSSKPTYAGPWAKAKYEWIVQHYPYGTALRIEQMARNLGADDPAVATALDNGTLAVICGRHGIITVEDQ